jgi:hypothetical protein
VKEIGNAVSLVIILKGLCSALKTVLAAVTHGSSSKNLLARIFVVDARIFCC